MLYLAILAILGAFAVRLVRGEGVRRLDVVRLEHWPLALVAITLQLALFAPSMAGTLSAWPVPMHAASLLLMLLVLVANRQVPGITLVTVGLGLNAAVLVANGGFMPVDRDALVIAQGPHAELLEAGRHQKTFLAESETSLWVLGDILPAPPVGKVYSVGDLVAGLGTFVFLCTRRRLNEARVVGSTVPAAGSLP
jgi:Family of unknown function (DUF5317)